MLGRNAIVTVALIVVAAGSGCTAPGIFGITPERTELVADGVDTIAVRVFLTEPSEGAVVEVFADAGVLSASTAVLDDDGRATVTLTAEEERALGREGRKIVELRARVRFSADDVREATAEIAMVAPEEGPPLLFLEADPPAADADGEGFVTLRAFARRLPEDTRLTWSSNGGEIGLETPLEPSGGGGATATAVLMAPSEPVDLLARLTAGDANATVIVRFVEPGTPQYDLDGTFLQLSPARVRLESGSLVPNPQCVLAPSLILVDIDQEGTSVSARWTTCALTFPPVTTIVGQVTTEAPPSFLASVPVVSHGFTLSGPKLGAVWEPPESVVVGGAVLDDPASDALPTEPDDPRVSDDDEDGEPGVTVLNSLGNEQRVAYRTRGRTRGRVVSSNEILGDEPGDLVALTETSVFGIGASFLPNVIGEGSVFQIVRVDGRYGAEDADGDGDGSVTCEEALLLAPSLFDVDVPDVPFDCGGE